MIRALSIALTLTCAGCDAFTARVDYVFPQGFVGPAVIVFNDPNGLDKPSRGWPTPHVTYTFGSDGMLRFKQDRDNPEEPHYFHAAPDGTRTKIPFPLLNDVAAPDAVIVRDVAVTTMPPTRGPSTAQAPLVVLMMEISSKHQKVPAEATVAKRVLDDIYAGRPAR